MKVVNLDPAKDQKKKHRDEICTLLEQMKTMAMDGEVDEFVCASISENGDIQIHAVCRDFLGGLGLFEAGKKIFIDQKEEE